MLVSAFSSFFKLAQAYPSFASRPVIVYVGIYSKVGIFVVSENILFLIASSKKLIDFSTLPKKLLI